MPAALFAIASLLVGGTPTPDADFRVIARGPTGIWFFEPTAVVEENGLRRAHIYQTHTDGQVIRGKTVRFSDAVFIVDCEASSLRPEHIDFLDSGFQIIGLSRLPDAQPRVPPPTTSLGMIVGAVCGRASAPETLFAADWKVAARSLSE